ncbi:MAG: sigma 54-interacting transcriptional regulator [candidate division WOR-3 bacterium]
MNKLSKNLKSKVWSYEIDGIIKRIKVLYETEKTKVYLGEEPGGKNLVIKEVPYTNHKELYKEFYLLFNLNHSGIIKTYDFLFYPDYKSVLILEYLKGGSLRERIEKNNIKDLKKLVRNILDTLSYLEKNIIVHSDLKPENILFPSEESEYPVLSDFGLATHKKKSFSRGTPLYSAPEVLEGKNNTHKSDVFSLGVITFEILTGIKIDNYREYKSLFLDEGWKDKVKEEFWKEFLNITLNRDPEKRKSASWIMENIFNEKVFYTFDLEFIEKDREKIKKEILKEIKDKEREIILLKGEKGSGKTFFLKKIYSEIKEEINSLLIDGGKIPYLSFPEENLYTFITYHLLNIREKEKYLLVITDPLFHKKEFLNFLESLKEVKEFKNLIILIEEGSHILKGKEIILKKPSEERIYIYLENNPLTFEKPELLRNIIRIEKGNLKNIFSILKSSKNIEDIERKIKGEKLLSPEEEDLLSTLNIFGKLKIEETEKIFGYETIEKITKRGFIERSGEFSVPLIDLKKDIPYEKILKNLKDIKELSIEGKLIYTLAKLKNKDYSELYLIEEELENLYRVNPKILFEFFKRLSEDIELKRIPPRILKYYSYFLIGEGDKKFEEVLNLLKDISEKDYKLVYSYYCYIKGDFEKSYEILKDEDDKESLLLKGLALINTFKIKELEEVLKKYKRNFYDPRDFPNISMYYRIEGAYYEMKGDSTKAELSYKRAFYYSKKMGPTYRSYLYLLYYIEFLYLTGKKEKAIQYIQERFESFYKAARIFPYILLYFEFIKFRYYKDKKNLNFLTNIKKKLDIINKSLNLPIFEPYILSVEADYRRLIKEDPSQYYERAIELSEKYRIYTKLIDTLVEYLKYLRISENKKFDIFLKKMMENLNRVSNFLYRKKFMEEYLLFLALNRNLEEFKRIEKELMEYERKTENFERIKVLILFEYLLNIKNKEKLKEIKKEYENITFSSDYTDCFKNLFYFLESIKENKKIEAFEYLETFLKKSKNFLNNERFIKDFIIFFKLFFIVFEKSEITKLGFIPKLQNFITKLYETQEEEFLRKELSLIREELLSYVSFGKIIEDKKWKIFRNYLLYSLNYNKEEEFLKKTIEIIVKATEMERGMIFMKSEGEDKHLEIKVSYGLYKKDIGRDIIDISLSSVLNTTKKGIHFYVPDTLMDDSFKTKESVQKYRIRSIFCIPFFYEDKLLGAIYLDSKTKREFTSDDFEILNILTEIFSISYIRNKFIEKIEEEKITLEEKIRKIEKLGEIVGSRKFLERINDFIEKIKDLEKPIPILLIGETGTGKTLIAETIHKISIRKNRPIIFFSFNEVPETLAESELFGYKRGAFTGAFEDKIGLIEKANGGTIVLENIESIPLSLQDKLLRFLDTGKIRPLGSPVEKDIDVMVIATSLPEIEEKVERGEIRKDLYYRLKGYSLYISPLRERKDDLPYLVNHFLEEIKDRLKIKRKIKLSKEAWDCIYNYEWPGNVRELKYTLESAVLNLKEENIITPSNLKEEIRKYKTEKKFLSLEEMERNYIIEVLKSTNWNKSKAAKILKISRQNLIQKLKSYKILKI